MELKQKRNSNRIRYVFGDDEVQYSLQDGSGSRSFSVDYTDISRDRQTLEERNEWLRNVGVLWMILGAGLTGLSLTGDSGLKVSFWLWVGAFCYLVYRLRSTKFVILPSDKGNLLVIDDATGAQIVQEIETRRAESLRRDYDGFREDEEIEQQRRRFAWLHKEGALSDEELRERLGMLEVRVGEVGLEGEKARLLLN